MTRHKVSWQMVRIKACVGGCVVSDKAARGDDWWRYNQLGTHGDKGSVRKKENCIEKIMINSEQKAT